MFFMLLIHESNFVSIGYYLLYDLQAYILCIILDYKKSKFKHLIDDITIKILFSWNFASMKDIRKKKCNPMVDLSKFISNKKILSVVVVLVKVFRPRPFIEP